MPTSRSFYGGNNAFTSPGTANVSALFPRSLSEVSESSDALFPRSLSEFSQFSECSEDTGNKALDSARCPHRKSWKRLRAKKVCLGLRVSVSLAVQHREAHCDAPAAESRTWGGRRDRTLYADPPPPPPP